MHSERPNHGSGVQGVYIYFFPSLRHTLEWHFLSTPFRLDMSEPNVFFYCSVAVIEPLCSLLVSLSGVEI